MTRITVGVIGHVDHGKTALVRALTGIETDRLAEEKARGISIALGFAHFAAAPGVEVDLIDMPGHERFVRTMIAGASGIDAVLLVVAANEGVMPQTVEHLDIAALLGLDRAVVAVTKTDLVTPEEAEQVAADTLELLAERGFRCSPFPSQAGRSSPERGGGSPQGLTEGSKPRLEPSARGEVSTPPPPPLQGGGPPPRSGEDLAVLTSARAGTGIEPLRHALAALAEGHRPRREDGLAWLPIDRAFAIAGHGPVVTGTLRGAPVAAGDALELLPAGKALRVRTVQVHGSRVAAAHPGQRTALNLRDVETGELSRGMALGAAGAFGPSEWLTLALRAVADAPPLRNGMRLAALFGTAEVEVRLRLLDRDVLGPGESGFAQLHLAAPAAVPAREHAILRIPSPARTVAGGRILEPVARRKRRNAAQILARLAELRDLSPEELVAAEALREGMAASIAELSRLAALAPARVEDLLAALPVVVNRKGLVLRRADLDPLLAQLPRILAPQANGLSRNQLLTALPGTRAALLDEALARTLADKAIVRRGSHYAVPRPDEDRARERGEAERMAEIAETLRLGGLAPPNPAAVLTDAAAKRAVEKLLREGTVIRAVDRAKGKELLFHRDAVAKARARLAPLLAQGPGLLVTEIAAALGISRKFAMPLLDHLDTTRFTRRVGDRRIAFAVPHTEQ